MSKIIVIGAGVNGLTLALYLKKAGRDVLVLEKNTEAGGLLNGYEFHPGYFSPGLHYETSQLRKWVINDLNLESFGLKFAASSEAALTLGDGQQLAISQNTTETAKEIAKLSEKDAEAYKEFRKFYKTIEKPVSDFVNNPPADLVDPKIPDLFSLLKRGAALRRLGKKNMLTILRLAPMAVYDWLDEWFENGLVKAALALPAVTASHGGTWSPGTNAVLMIQQVCAAPRVEGEALGFFAALKKAADAAKIEVRYGAEVKSIKPGKGVELSGGEFIEGKIIAASSDPKKVMLDMLEANTLSSKCENRMMNYRMTGLCSQLLLALKKKPNLPGGAKSKVVQIVTDLDSIEKSFDASKYSELPDRPSLEIYFPEGANPVASVLIHFTPHTLKSGWSEEVKLQFVEKVIDQIEERIPGFKAEIISQTLLSPQDIEERYSLTSGDRFYGEQTLDQLMVRPSPECAQYSTPFEGLYLCSGGSFPGGGLTAAPGALAAKAILANS
jgi:phytoene dehydrogenase-like protein